MKKITFNFKKVFALSTILFSGALYSQQFPFDFTTSTQLFNGVGGATTSLVADPTNANNQVLQVAGNGEKYDTAQRSLVANINLADNGNNTITFRVRPAANYGTRTHLLKFENRGAGGGAAQTELSFTTTGTEWQNISLNFPADLGNYALVVLFPDFDNTSVGTYLFDDLAGGTNIIPVPDPAPTTAAPVPTTINNQVYSIYNDTNNYTTTFPVQYSFGLLAGEPDLDPATTVVNKAFKFNFGAAGYGQGEASSNVSTFGFVSFDYWAQPGMPNGFRFVMISKTGTAPTVERVYQIGTEEPLVRNAWKKVEIPMSFFTGLGFNSANFFQWKVSPFNDSVDNAGFVYVDNILLTTNSVLSNDNFTKTNFKVYPNPASTELTIDSANDINNISVINMLGQEVFSRKVSSTLETINISNLQSGIYMVKVDADNGSSTQKFTKI